MSDPLRPASQWVKTLQVHPSGGLRCCLLGGFRLERGGKSLTAQHFHLRKGRDLLILLTLAPEQRLHKEHLLELLWPGRSPPAAAHSLRHTLYKLRLNLFELDPSARIEHENECLVLVADGGVSTDVADFEQLACLALSHNRPLDSQAAAICQDAIVAYTGELLPEDGPSDLFYQRREGLRQLYLDVLIRLADYHLLQQEYPPAIHALQKAVSIDPPNEGAHTRLIRAYALNGQRQAALRQYQSLEAALLHELEVEPTPESQLLREQILSGELRPKPSPLAWLPRPHHNLPVSLSSFIGREGDLARIRELAQAERLLALIGAGGVGKTRLALKVAESLLQEFPDGVYWVELAWLTNSDLLAKTVLDVFRLPEQFGRSEADRLVDYLKGRHMLLVLDNCEHLLNSCASLVEVLLKSCPHLHVLLTSRVRLNLPGERTYYVPPLAAPGLTPPGSLHDLVQYDAVRLFIERSGSFSQGFIITEANAPAVAQICRYLDGIPLALELAAAHCCMLTAQQIAEQLADAFRLLTRGSLAALPRHRTLRASMNWSYDLLSGKQRLLLQRLSVFADGWGLDAVQAVCVGGEIEPSEVLDLLEDLVDNSIVLVDNLAEIEARYRLLETVRQYAHERLVDSGEESVLHTRHLNYFLHLAEQADMEIRGSQQRTWYRHLEMESANLVSALDWSFNSPAGIEMGVRLACALTWYWLIMGNFQHKRHYLASGLSRGTDFGSTAISAKILFHAGIGSAWGLSFLEPNATRDYVEQSLEIWRELGQQYSLEAAQSLLALGWVRKFFFKDDTGLEDIRQSIGEFKQIGNAWWQAWALDLYIFLVWDMTDAETIGELLKEETQLWSETGDRFGQALPLQDYGSLALKCGEFESAQSYLHRSLEIFQDLGSKGMLYQILRDLGHAARAQQAYDQAQAHYKDCLVYAQELGMSPAFPKIYAYLGLVALHQADGYRALGYFSQAAQLCDACTQKDKLILLAGLAGLHMVRDKPAAAALLFGAFTAQVENNQITTDLVDQIEIDHYLELCRVQIEPAAFDQAWNTGRAMSFDQALAYALE